VLARFATASKPTRRAAKVDRTGDPLSADRDFCCPSAGRFVSVYREYPLSVLTVDLVRAIRLVS
jgi:hypothetical protein